MLPLFIRYFFIVLCSLYSFYQVTNYNNNYKVIVLSSTIVSLFCIQFPNNAISSRILFMFILSYIIVVLIFPSNYFESLISLLISFGLSYVFLSIASSIISLILLLTYKTASSVPYSYIDLPLGLLQFIFLKFLLQIKRFTRGISSLIKTQNITIGIIFSSFLIIYYAFVSINKNNTTYPMRILACSIFIFTAIFFLFYWRYRITQTYREKLRLANEKSMLDEINEHKLTVDKLKADNRRLASIVHADNKLVPAMLTAVTEHLENSDNLTMEELAVRGHELSEQLRNMARDRQGILESQPNDTASLPKSGLHTVDGMLSFMEARAREHEIAYKVTMDENIKEPAAEALSEEDLLRLFGDLIDNAVIAVKHSDKEKAVLIHMGILQGHFLLEISDSGIPFSVSTYQHFGNEQHTTHKDSGGSGIGLMDIWKIKKKYRASLHIYEFPIGHGVYTKKISFVFDRKNHFLLQTDRYKEITRELTRGDLYVFPYKSE